jgi:hypothetical protein
VCLPLINMLHLCLLYISHDTEITSLWTIYVQVLCQSRLCAADHANLTYLMLQRQLNLFNGRKLDRRQV